MVAGDNGILTQAVNAADSNNLAEVKSDLSLALTTCQTNYFADRSGNAGSNAQVEDYFTIDKIKTELGSNYSNVEGTINIGLGSMSELKITTSNGTEYGAKFTIEYSGGVEISRVIEVGKWYYVDDTYTSITDGTTTLEIGDTVNYKAVTGATTTSYTSSASSNGYSDQTFTLADNDSDYEWQVMGVDEITGEILIVLSNASSTGDNYIKTDTGGYYYLKGQVGYENGVNELNNICSLFGQVTGASGVRSITIEDVNKLTGFDIEVVGYNSGEINEYGNEVTYTLNDSGISWSGKNKVSGSSSAYTSFTFFNNGTWKSLNSGGSTTLISNYYKYSKLDYSSSLVFPSSKCYWLSCPMLVCSDGYASYGYFSVFSENMGGNAIFSSNSSKFNSNGGVRIVVSLSSNVTLTGSSSEGWNIE